MGGRVLGLNFPGLTANGSKVNVAIDAVTHES